MALSPAPESRREEPLDIKDLVFSYSSRTWRTLLGLLPFPSSNLLPRIAWPGRARRRKPVLPLPLHSSVVRYPPIAAEASRVFVILEDILDHTLSNLHTIQKSLLFWQRREEGTNAQKIYFMIFERGPRAFIDGTYQILSRSVSDGSPIQYLCQSAADTISDRISVLTSLQHCLATFLAEIYLEVNKFGELLTTGSEKSLPILLLAINSLFSKLEASISHLHVIYKGEDPLSSDGGNSRALLFEKWPKMDQERSEWTDTEIRDATNLIYKNLQRLDSYISFILSSCRKPGRMTLYWLHYTCGAVGLSVCSLWLLRHSSLMGSSDIDNWIREVKESTAGFYKDHVEQPPLICQTSPANSARYGSGVSLAGIMLGEIMDEIGGCLASVLKYASRQYGMSCSKGYASNCSVIAICLQASGKATMNLAFGDELFETFRRRHKGVMEVEEVQLTANSLHRMLLAFTEQVKDQKLPDNISDQEMLEVVMARYEKEVMHPLQNLLSGELARAMLIQIQKLKLDLETAMLELDQILKANEINFAILAALPAFFLSLILLMLIRAWVLQDKGAEGRGRIARLQRRLLLVEVEKHLMQFEMCMDQGLEEDAQCMFGLVLYNLDRLYKAVERHAKETGEWMSFRQDIVDLVKPDLKTMYKLSVVSRMGRMYDCLLPSSKHR